MRETLDAAVTRGVRRLYVRDAQVGALTLERWPRVAGGVSEQGSNGGQYLFIADRWYITDRHGSASFI
jgi:hypothetical protein